MSRGPRVDRDRTLLQLATFFLVLLAVSAAADLWRGTGGSAWWRGVARADETNVDEAASSEAGHFVVRDVLLFDGEALRPGVDVLVHDGRIVEVGENLQVSGESREIDGSGRTLMPGMIDAHTHSWGDALRASLSMGVTAVLDMFTEPGWASQRRQEQAAGEAGARADLYSAGVLATPPGGHGTQYGMEIPTLERPEEADEWVAARAEEGSDFIKIVVEDGSIGRDFNRLASETAAAVIEAAHARDLLAVVHVSRQMDAVEVIEAGADGLVHVFWDEAVDESTIETFRTHGAFVVPTLAVIESISGGTGAAALLADPRIEPFVMPTERASLESAFPGSPGRAVLLERALETVRRLHRSGVPILAGTDAPNPGTAHGFSMHRELELLMQAGLSVEQALAAATSVTADAFGLEGRGRVRAGARADLLLFEGDPRSDIRATRAVVDVWKGGERLDRRAIRRSVARATASPATGDGLVSDFDEGDLAVGFGSGWQVSTDRMMGGSSTAEMTVVEGGADDSSHALELTGELAGGVAYPWSGAMFMTGRQPFAPTDLSAYTGLSFWLWGEGAVAVMLFSSTSGQTPVVQTVPVTPAWTLHELDFGDFPGVDPAGLQAVLFSAAEPGAFSFAVDQVRLR